MRCTRQDSFRSLPFHGVGLADGRAALRRHIIRYIRGIKGPRQNPVTAKQIHQWFYATDAAFLDVVLSQMIADGEVRVIRPALARASNGRDAYRYEIDEIGEPTADAAAPIGPAP